MIGNPPDDRLLVPAMVEHIRRAGRVPEGAATDPGFWNSGNDDALKDMNVRKDAVREKPTGLTSCTPKTWITWFSGERLPLLDG